LGAWPVCRHLPAARYFCLRKFKKIALGSGAAVALIGLGIIVALAAAPPDVIRIAANYTAKIVCSNVFIAGREPEEVLNDDVQSPGSSVLRLMRVSVDRDRGVVRAGLLGFIGDGLAVAHPGVGCTVIPDGKLAGAAHPEAWSPPKVAGPGDHRLWPDGDAVETDAALDKLIADDALTGVETRAVLVVQHGRLVAERYAQGFDSSTPQLGWSMGKAVMAGLIGVLVKDGRLGLDQRALWPPGDGRADIRIADLLAMSSGLRFNEGYGAVSDVTRMLFLEPDMAAFARAQPLDHPVGTFWSYSSGTAVMLARIFQDAAGPEPLKVAHERLFGPLGMTSAVIESDVHGTWVGSSYMYATARDWARYGQFLLQQGVWQGREILPPGYVAMMSTPVAASGGQYGHGQVWIFGSDATRSDENPDLAFGLPADTFWMLGHDGQSVAIIPSRDLVVVRLGLTPRREHYQPQLLVRALLHALPWRALP
jgi:CubicO group peptidase (beta-lactamase class C family)